MRQYKPRVCERCGREYIPTSSNQKYCPECKETAHKEVNLETAKRWYKTHKEEKSEYDKEYRKKNAQIIKEKKKEEYLRHRERYLQHFKEYYRKNKQKFLEYSLQWHRAHPEKSKMSTKKYYLTHKEQKKEYNRRYKNSHREIYRESSRKSHAKRKHNLGFILLNKWQPGYEAHHLDRHYVIYIPKEIHQSIKHSVLHNYNMDEINAIAWNYL